MLSAQTMTTMTVIKDDGCDGCDDCEHCDSQDECKLYNKAIEQGLSKDEAMLLTLLGKIIGGKK